MEKLCLKWLMQQAEVWFNMLVDISVRLLQLLLTPFPFRKGVQCSVRSV